MSDFIDKRDIAKLKHTMERARHELGKSYKESVQWAGNTVLASLGPRTKKSAKRRPIEQNPSDKWKTDGRVARWGVMKYRPERFGGGKVFDPISRGGEYGAKIKYISSNVTLLKVGSKWERFKGGMDAATGVIVPSMRAHKKTFINRSGMASQSWTKLKNKLSRGGVLKVGNVNTSEAKWFSGFMALQISNRLKYIKTALIGGESAIGAAVRAGTSSLMTKVDLELKKRLAKV